MKRAVLLIYLLLGASTLMPAREVSPANIGSGISDSSFPKIYRPFISIFRRIFPGRKSSVECYSADVTAISLSAVEVRKDASETKIGVSTTAIDHEGDLLTYKYTVTGGKIIGTGANVVWDLSGIAPGPYFITAAVDDGCGFCGRTFTRKVEVLKCAGCQLRETE